MLRWLIIGGGIHGTYLSNLLVGLANVGRDDLRVLDPHARPLAVWNRNTERCGMRFLRSPATHNVDLPILSLYRFAKETRPEFAEDFIPPYNRPSLDLFRAHCRHAVERRGLKGLRIHGQALALKRTGRGIAVETAEGVIYSRNVLLALGLGEQPCWPSWAKRLNRNDGSICHVFAPAGPLEYAGPGKTTTVIGGGITAVQTALKLASLPDVGRVRLLSRRDLLESQYDFDPCWIGPKCLRNFHLRDYRERRAVIDRARITGSVPGEVLLEFYDALAEGLLDFRQGRVLSAAVAAGGIRMETDRGSIHTDRIVLATGFSSRRPGGTLIDQAVAEFRLPCNPCGYPIVGGDLQWGPGLFVSGPLAELQLGPCARNIVGARNAGRMLLQSIAGGGHTAG
jgi:hypothetical protein